MKNRYLNQTIFLFLVFLLTSCASAKWEARLDKQVDIVLPPPPNQAKVEYLGEISSFVQTSESLKTMIFGKGDAGRIVKPVAIAVGADGRMAIADHERKGIHFFIPETQSYQFLGKFGRESFASPVSVAFDGNMQLYISDSVLRKVLVFDSTGKFLREIVDAGGREFGRPTGIAYQEQNDLLYITDTTFHTVHIFDGRGQYKQSFGKRGTKAGQFNMPTHIATGRLGRIYVNDAMNFRAQIFSPPDLFVSKFGHHGDGSGDFAMPKGIAVDRRGRLYVAETLFDLVQVFDDDGRYLMAIGSKGTNPGQFWMPSGIYIDRLNKLYVCDTYNKRIQLFQIIDVAKRLTY